jgi:hypothetical protein
MVHGSPLVIFSSKLFFFKQNNHSMITVKSAIKRIGKDEKTLIALELNGDIELVQSQNTGIV